MNLQEKLFSWFVKNFMMQRKEVFDRPGFIVNKGLTGKGYCRQLFLPESVLENMEEEVIEKHPEEGHRILYGMGKNFGYRLGQVMELPTVKLSPGKKSKVAIQQFAKYLESFWADEVWIKKMDLERGMVNFSLKNFSICRKNGMGYIFTEGGPAGLGAFITGNKKINSVHVACEGRGDDKGELIIAPSDILKNQVENLIDASVEEDLGPSKTYRKINEIRKTDYAEDSLEDLINRKFFEINENKVNHGGDRYILSEASLIYLLARELSEVGGGEEVLFDSAFEYGGKLAEEEEDRKMEKFIREYLSACGWGDTLIKEKDGKFKVYGFLFPWTKFWEETSFPIYRGLVSGLLSGYAGREVRLDGIEKDIKGEGFTVIASEK